MYALHIFKSTANIFNHKFKYCKEYTFQGIVHTHLLKVTSLFQM